MANIKIQLGNFSLSDSSKQKEYLYQDITSNFLLNSNKTDVLCNHDINAIFGSLRNIFTYTPGERMLKPDFGIDFKGLLYEPMNDHTANSIGLVIYNAIQKWEPRLDIESLNIDAEPDANTYYISLKFKSKQLKIKETQQFTFNLRAQL